jgi:hypothetical protein
MQEATPPKFVQRLNSADDHRTGQLPEEGYQLVHERAEVFDGLTDALAPARGQHVAVREAFARDLDAFEARRPFRHVLGAAPDQGCRRGGPENVGEVLPQEIKKRRG